MLRENFSALKEQRDAQMLIEMRKQIVEEAKAGIWTPDQARKQLVALKQGQKENQPPAAKRQKTIPVRSYSPDWDSDLHDTDEEL